MALDTTDTSSSLRGTPVVPGLAYGPVVQVRTEVPPDAVAAYRARAAEDPEAVMSAYDEAVAAVVAGLERRASHAAEAAAKVLAATGTLARDRGLRSAVSKRVKGGDDLVGAVAGGVQQFVDMFAKLGGLMAERVTDLEDIGRRLTAHVVGVPEPGLDLPDEPSVVVAADLAPADTAGLRPDVVLALVTERGGPTSHTAIIARQLGIPCVVGVSGAGAVPSGTRVLVDGTTGEVDLGPDEDDAVRRTTADAEHRAALAGWTGPGATADGVAVKLLANVADGPSAAKAAKEPVEGVGLFRTELCFLDRKVEPSAAEQADIYGEVLDAFSGRGYVVVRTLDAGSDKPVAFATLPGEENPALGVRGLRLSFGNPGLLSRQLEGIALAAERTGTETWVMAPMVATVEEAATFADQVRALGLKAGVMVEVPSAALLAHRMLEVVDFLSIGTNDLTQYTMAADRIASDLAHLTDPWQPAVLQLIAITAAAGREAGKPVGICGEAAADPLLAPALIGMGITSLSMAPAAVRAVGAALASSSIAQCQEAAEAALAAGDPHAARSAVHRVLAG